MASLADSYACSSVTSRPTLPGFSTDPSGLPAMWPATNSRFPVCTAGIKLATGVPTGPSSSPISLSFCSAGMRYLQVGRDIPAGLYF